MLTQQTLEKMPGMKLSAMPLLGRVPADRHGAHTRRQEGGCESVRGLHVHGEGDGSGDPSRARTTQPPPACYEHPGSPPQLDPSG